MFRVKPSVYHYFHLQKKNVLHSIFTWIAAVATAGCPRQAENAAAVHSWCPQEFPSAAELACSLTIGFWSILVKQRQRYMSSYITSHYITLKNITLHYITLRYVTLRYITLHYITWQYNHYMILYCIVLYYMLSYYNKSYYFIFEIYIILNQIILHIKN